MIIANPTVNPTTSTVLSPAYNSGALAANMFANTAIVGLTWGIVDSRSSLRIYNFTDSTGLIGTWNGGGETRCQDVRLGFNEYINKVTTYAGTCSLCNFDTFDWVRGIIFTTNLNNNFSCITPEDLSDITPQTYENIFFLCVKF